MKPSKSTIQVTSTLKGEDIQMGIAKEAEVFIMGLLTDAYSDNEMACIREYSTNAADSHVEAGVNKPIEITTPGPLSPVFTIRDFGIGLDAEDIRKIYSQYGISTKRDTNDAVGLFGVGCKSALAYTSQFNLTGWKNGIKTHVSISRDTEGIGTQKILSETESDEPDGLAISIPTKLGNNFAGKCKKFFNFWDEGSVKIDGKIFEPVKPVEKIDKNIFLYDARELGQTPVSYGSTMNPPIVVMGGVAYPFEKTFSPSINKKYTLVIFVPIGTVDFTPSREALTYSDRTNEFVEKFKENWPKKIANLYSKEIKSCKTKGEVFAKFASLRDISEASSVNVKWKNQDIPPSIVLPKGTKRYSITYYGSLTHSNKYGNEVILKLHDLSNKKAIIITNFDNQKFTSVQRRKVEEYRSVKKGITSGRLSHGAYFLTVPSVVSSQISSWLNDVETYDWSDVRSWIDPNEKAIRETNQYKGGYPSIDKVGNYVNFNADIPKKDLYYTQAIDRGSISYAKRSLDSNGVKHELVVGLAANRVNKFLRLYPYAKKYQTAIKEVLQAEFDSLPNNVKEALSYWGHSHNKSERYLLSMLKSSDIHDPEVKKLIKLAKLLNNTNYSKWDFGFYETRNTCISKRYPLIKHIGTYQIRPILKDIQEYMNALYRVRKERVK